MTKTHHTHRIKQPSGYALVVVLVLLSLASLVLAGMTRLSLSRATEAIAAQDELRYRWATRSIRHAVLPRSGEILAKAHEDNAAFESPITKLNLSLVFNGNANQTYDIALSDEQTKANLNRIMEQSNEQAIRDVIADLRTQSNATDALTLELRPLSGRSGQKTKLPRFGTWSQVFPDADPATIFTSNPDSASLSLLDQITLFGNGRINFRTASEPVLRSILNSVVGIGVGGVEIMIQERQRDPEIPLESLLQVMDLSEGQKKQAESWLTEESQCFRLVIVLRDPKRTRYEQSVITLDAESDRDLKLKPSNTAPRMNTMTW